VKEYSPDLSLADFLAYLFPGAVALIALGVVLELSPFKRLLTEMAANVLTGFLLIALSYFVGIVISSLTYNLEEPLRKHYKLQDPRSEIPLDSFHEEVRGAFQETLGIEWNGSVDHFYLARSLIREKMPPSARVIDRQGALGQLRRNSIIPVVLLGIVGGYAGVLAVCNEQQWVWGSGLALFSVLGSWVVLAKLVQGLHKNRRREARETYAALLVYYSQSKKRNPKDTREL